MMSRRFRATCFRVPCETHPRKQKGANSEEYYNLLVKLGVAGQKPVALVRYGTLLLANPEYKMIERYPELLKHANPVMGYFYVEKGVKLAEALDPNPLDIEYSDLFPAYRIELKKARSSEAGSVVASEILSKMTIPEHEFLPEDLAYIALLERCVHYVKKSYECAESYCKQGIVDQNYVEFWKDALELNDGELTDRLKWRKSLEIIYDMLQKGMPGEWKTRFEKIKIELSKYRTLDEKRASLSKTIEEFSVYLSKFC